jgi:hypothetical protein
MQNGSRACSRSLWLLLFVACWDFICHCHVGVCGLGFDLLAPNRWAMLCIIVPLPTIVGASESEVPTRPTIIEHRPSRGVLSGLSSIPSDARALEPSFLLSIPLSIGNHSPCEFVKRQDVTEAVAIGRVIVGG